MLQIKVGIQLSSLKQPFKKALHTAAQMGADGVEINGRSDLKPQEMSRTAIRQIRKMLEDLNLRVTGVSFRTRRGYNVNEDLDRRIDATKQAMKMAFELGANAVINQVGAIPTLETDADGNRQPPKSEENDWNLLVQTLTDLGQYGHHVGAMLAAETGSESGEALGDLIDSLPPGYLGVNFDPGNLAVNAFPVSDSLRRLAPHVLHFHAKDGVRDLAQGRGIEVALGRGSVDFPELFAILEEQEYRGYFTIERLQSGNPIFEIGEAVKYLRSF